MNVEAPPIERRRALEEPLAAYERMCEIRAVEERIQSLYSAGYVRGSTHLCIGQEAVNVGIARATRITDLVSCTYRGHGMALALGVLPEAVLGEVTGRTIGCARGLGGSMHLFDMEVGLLPTFAIVGAGLPIAVGVALSAQVRETDEVAIAVFGDGAANIGAFHEALNLASIWRLPVLFVCENNLYGEYTRIELTTPVQDLAVRASAYAIPGFVVDGQDVDAVTSSVSKAIHRARSGHGPSMLEMKTYRYSGHSRSDPATYRPPGELEAWKERDPIAIYARRLRESGAPEDSLQATRERVTRCVDEATERALASPEPAQEEMLQHIFAQPSTH